MDIIVKMRVKPGDTHVSKATIKMYDEKNMELAGQLLLEGETAETNLTIPPGGHCVICEYERPVTYDAAQHATVYADLTPEDPIEGKAKDRPVGTPSAKDDYPKGAAKKPEDTKADFNKTVDPSIKK